MLSESRYITLLGTLVHLFIRAIIQSANGVAAVLCEHADMQKNMQKLQLMLKSNIRKGKNLISVTLTVA